MYVKPEEFSESSIFFLPHEKRAVVGCSNSYYHEIPLNYMYEREGLDEFVMEGCEMEAKCGITKIISHDDKLKFSMASDILEIEGNNAACFVESIGKIRLVTVNYLNENREKIGRIFPIFMYSNFGAGGFIQNPIINKLDPITGDVIPDYNSQMNLKLIEGEFPSLFVDIDDNIIPWEKLSQVEVRFIPIIRFRSITSTGTFQIEILKAIVTRISHPRFKYNQSETISHLRKNRPNIAHDMANSLAFIDKNNKHSSVKGDETELTDKS